MTGKYQSILGTIGRTPIVRLNRLAPSHVNIYAKLEAFNPMGSVKDRLALGVIEAAERSGDLKPGQTVIEATSGNTGIGLAMVCAQKGYPLVIVMAENFSVERRKLMRFLGAKVILTPAAQKGSGMLAKAVELAKAHGWFLCRQFESEANADIHSATTAPEILSAFANEPLDYWVSGFGTGGTLKGVARVLKEKSPRTKIVVCEPDNVPLLASGIAQPRATDGAPAQSHPSFRPHVMQGWSPDFISKLAEDAATANLIDDFVAINGADALRLSRELARQEGIFTGITAGATLAGALKVAQTAPAGSNILCMLPDTGERYLSTALFDGIDADMDEAELDISRSTPSCRFDAAPMPAPAAPATPPLSQPMADADAEAAAFIDDAINKKDVPVTMFALEWCEFCWSARKFFARLNIPYRSIDLDSVAYQKDGWGNRIRAALAARTGVNTIPQIFIHGAFIGGATDLFAAYRQGDLAKMLAAADPGIKLDPSINPEDFLPKWRQAS